MLSPEEFGQLRRLHVQLGRQVDSPFTGQYKSAFRGQGMEFEEVRPYIPGDDVRHIDWNVTARANAPFIKEYREERELTLVLVVDVSGSMCFGAGGENSATDKRLQAARLAGALAFAAIRNGDRVGLMSFCGDIERYLPPRKSRGHAWAVIRTAFEDVGGQGTDLSLALERLGRSLKRRAVICVLSDFVSDNDYLTQLGILTRRHKVHCLMIADKREQTLPSVGLVRVEDVETGKRMLIDSAAMRTQMSPKERLRRLIRTGARTRWVDTGDDPIVALQHHFRGAGSRV